MVPKRLLPGNRAYLDGNLARRKFSPAASEYVIWDTELAGFGLRVRPSGNRYWFVRLRRRGRHCRVSLGKVEDVDALTARGEARKRLAEVALEGLPQRVTTKIAPVVDDYAEEFWTDCARHWKESTQKRNRNVLVADILPHFGKMRLDLIGRAEIARWRDDYANGRESRYNRSVPVLSAMFKYAEQLGYIRKGSNPCRGMPGFRKIKKERFLSPQEFYHIARQLDAEEAKYPGHVTIVRLLIFTGARVSEIRDLEWDWVQLPRLLLPDSKTGAKTIWLGSQAVRIFQSIERADDARFVFPNRTGERPMSLSPWWEAFRRRCALPDLRIHDLRHSFASVAVRERVALATIGRLLGHVLPETTARYAHLADETIAEAAQRVSGGLAGNLGLSE
ncbi:MAG: tyrosine-type recombinase/integrase [Gammaproteobacteria bacterium]|nr:tyrosine-type recombinase/integrase [Novosphingobium sp.]MCP5143190.1 tyrosine-type recombinase/integrase [Gammaproteobacteria bacterium]